MGIPPGVPVKAAKSIGPCPSYCRADCPGTQRPAHPPEACPGVPAAWLPAGRTATYTESTLYPFFFAISNVTYFLSGEVLPENTPVFDFNRQALRLRRLASSGDRLGVASSYESGRRRVDGKTAIRKGRYVTLRRDRGRSACG